MLLVADGIIPVKRAVYKCNICRQHVAQAPMDYLAVGAWPSSLNSSHMKTIVDQKLLQMWDSHWLHNPQASLSGFLKGVAHAAGQLHTTQVICQQCCQASQAQLPLLWRVVQQVAAAAPLRTCMSTF